MVGLIIIVAAIAALLIGGGLRLNTAFVPTPQDEAMRLEASAQKTANFNGTAYDQGAGFAPGGIGMPMAAVVKPSAVDRTTGDETYTFVLEESSDNSTFTACGPSVVLASTSTSAFSVPGFVNKRYVRCKLTVAGTTPIITYEAWLNANVSLNG